MNQQKIYIESTVWYQMVNYSESEFKDMSHNLLHLIKEEKFDVYISNVVLHEFAYNSKKYIKKLEKLIDECKPRIILQTDETADIAHAYIENAFMSKPKEEVIIDAYHAAIATTANISYIASYNYRNLLHVRTLEHFNAVNLLAGYHHYLSIMPPFMFVTLEDYEGEKGSVDSRVWDIKKEAGKKMIEINGLDETERSSYYKDLVKKYAKKFNLRSFQPMRVSNYL